jgi:hypothetical protein
VSAARTPTPPPDMGGLTDDFDRMKKLREQQTQQPPAPAPAPAPAAPQLPLADVPDDEPQPVMTRRSWYVTKASADALAAAVDDIHHITRGVPKHVIASMMFDLAARNADGIAQELGRTLASRITSDTGDTH